MNQNRTDDASIPCERQTLVAQAAGERLDRMISAGLAGLSRSQIQRLIRQGNVSVDGVAVLRPGLALRGGERVDICVPPAEPELVVPEAIPLDIVYQDQALLVVNKPAGMVVHPGAGHQRGTLANALMAHAPQLASVGSQLRPGIVHRLDRDTSGLLVVALQEQVLLALKAQFRSRAVTKRYLALAEGLVTPPEGIIDAPVGRSAHRRKRMAVIPDGRPAVTIYHTLETFDNHTLLDVLPRSGRTHQIRVHLAFLGFPVAGDRVYGRRRKPQGTTLGRQFLHAYQLTFALPDGRLLSACATLPDDLQQVLNRLGCRWSPEPTGAILRSADSPWQEKAV